MARRRSGAGKGSPAQVNDQLLPQNIVSMGGSVEENKNIYISQPVYKAIHKFTQGKTTNESGGILVGHIIQEFGKTNIIIIGFVEAKYCEATPTTLKFTHETWEYCHREFAKKYPDEKILGWIHTHPDYGIFLSEYDKFIQQNFFREEYQIAYVVDPIQKMEGFYFWFNGDITRCKGFYIFDKTGVKIDIADGESENMEPEGDRLFSFKNLAILLLTAAVILLAFSTISLRIKVNTIERNQQSLVVSVSQNLSLLQQQITTLKSELAQMKRGSGSISDDTNTNTGDGE
jgi:proteasome lid subunit RPN8/RPN11